MHPFPRPKQPFRRLVIGLPLVIMLAACGNIGANTSGGTPTPTPGRDRDGSIVVDGTARTYHLHLPPQQAATMPLVVVLHGYGMTGADTLVLTHMNELADQRGVIVVYPDGLYQSWTEGDRQGIDVKFIPQLITTLRGQFSIDARRIYIAGFSQGGSMAQRLGCELADEIAAIVSVAETLAKGVAPGCTPARPLPILFVHGVNDPIVPHAGGESFFSATEALTFWAKRNGCEEPPATRTLPDRVQDGTHVSETLYAQCQGGAQVGLFTVEGGGHTWPSGEQFQLVDFIGLTTHQIDNADLWAFLSQFQTT